MFICQTPESAYFLLASVEIKMKVHSVQACLLRVKIEYVASDLLRPGGGGLLWKAKHTLQPLHACQPAVSR